jgi:hypothetical protein
MAHLAVLGQKKKKPLGTVQLVERTVVCKSCPYLKPPLTIDNAKNLIVHDTLLSDALNKLSPNFMHIGDKFVLLCEPCKDGPTAGFLVLSDGKGGNLGSAFGTKLYASKSIRPKKKGAEIFYRFNQLISFLTDSVLVFDSIQISTKELTDANPGILSTLRAKFVFNNISIERVLPYDPVHQQINISYKTIFGSKLTRDITDTIPVSLYYLDVNNQPVYSDNKFNVFFATDEEKKAIKELYETYVTGFPGWKTEDIAIEIAVPVMDRYKHISFNNFIGWLHFLKHN